MKCPECGNLIKKGANFCGKCGAKVIVAIQEDKKDIVAQDDDRTTIEIENEKEIIDETIKDTNYDEQETIPVTGEIDTEQAQPTPQNVQSAGRGKKIFNVIKMVGSIIIVVLVIVANRWERLNAKKEKLINHMQSAAYPCEVGGTYIYRFDYPLEQEEAGQTDCSLKAWSLVYKEDKSYLELEDETIHTCIGFVQGEDGLENGGKIQYDWNEDVMKIGLDWVDEEDEEDTHCTEMCYWIEDDRFTITADGKSYGLADWLEEYFRDNNLATVMKNDLEVVKNQMNENDMSYRDLTKLEYEDMKAYTYVSYQEDDLLPTSLFNSIWPVTLDNITLEKDYSGTTSFQYRLKNDSEVDYKQITFNLFVWDENMLPIENPYSDKYYFEWYAENVATNSERDGYIDVYTDNISYYLAVPVTAEDFDGNIWENPLRNYFYDHYAGKKLDSDMMNVASVTWEE